MAGGGCIPLILPMDPPLVINYGNHQKRLAYQYFSHLAPLLCSFLLKGNIKRGTGGGGHGTMPSSINTLLTRRKSIIVMRKSVRINSV